MLSPAMKLLLVNTQTADPFPVIEETIDEEFNATTSTAVSMPSTVNSGELLLMLGSTENRASATPPAGWTLLGHNQQGGDLRCFTMAKTAAGTEGGTTQTITFDSSVDVCVVTMRISAWGGTVSTDIDYTANNNQGTPLDAPSVTAGWGADDNLFIVLHVCDSNSNSITAAPTNYTGLYNGGGTYERVDTMYRKVVAASDDPGLATETGGGGNRASQTLVVKPGSSGS